MTKSNSESTKSNRWSGKPILVFLTVGLFLGGGIGAWHYLKDSLRQETAYRLSPDRIRVPEAPPWVSKSFLDDVLKSLGPDCSLLDPGISQKIFQAFSVDPWVEEVKRVEIRYPSGADVQLVYRVPVALVEVPGQGLFPVDRLGVLLQTDYFIHVAPDKKHDYPRIVGVRSKPSGPVGTAWGDPLVHAAALVAGNLADVLPGSGIVRIVPSMEPTSSGSRCARQMETAEGTKVLWGFVDSHDPKIESKKQRLKEIIQTYQSLDKIPPMFRPINLELD